MTPEDSRDSTGEPPTTDGPTRRGAMQRATAVANAPISLTRRDAVRTTAGLSAAALGLTGAFAGSASSDAGDAASESYGIEEFETLRVSDDNRIVGEDGETFVMRGLSIPDPKRLEVTKEFRGKTATQLIDLLTDNAAGWYPRVIRVPASPEDIGEHPMGFAGPEYEHGELESPDAVADDRRKERPPQPVAFEEEELVTYLEEHYDPVVERCAERGVYCIVDYHRHRHEQPPGKEEPLGAENHRPYASEYTNYWARNTFSGTVDGTKVEFTEEDPASWGHVDAEWIDAYGYDTWEDRSDLEGTPFAYESWQVNEALLEEVQLFWEVVAERYGDMDHVLFEPYNEPAAPGIWGPVEGCGAKKQLGLWDTYLEDFAGPIVDTIRDQGYEGLLLMGVPAWSRSVQALHWRDFEDAGYENVAVTYHNRPEQGVSQMHNWFNDTEYQSYGAVEEETGQALEDPYLEPPDSVDEQACWGWEPYESEGLQEAMEHHPIAITQFGWVDNSPYWHLTPSFGTTLAYGEPLLSRIEEDERVSWVASFADVRWEPQLFEYPDGPNEGELGDVLVNDNFYDTRDDPTAELPVTCEEPPCEWELLYNPDSGEYLKDRLAALSDDATPFEMAWPGNGDCDPESVAVVDGQRVCDVDGDDAYMDVNGDASVTNSDVTEFFSNQHTPAWDERVDLFDFTGDDDVGQADVVALFESL